MWPFKDITTEEQAPTANWTVLVYLAGDNDLTAEMVWGLQELKKTSADLALAEKGINVVAHFDPRGLRSRRYDIALANRPGVARAQDGDLDATVVYTPPFVDEEMQGHEELENLGVGPGLSAFVMSQVAQLQNAKRFLIVLSGHGSGAEEDFLTDADPKTSLSIPELRVILSEARHQHYERFIKKDDWTDTNDNRIHVLGMDTCLMSNIEVCYELRNSVNYIVASEGFVENTGWPYRRVVEALLGNGRPEGDPLVVSKRIARSYANFYRDYEISGVSTDIAVCNLEAFRSSNALVQKLGELATLLIPQLEGYYARRLVELAIPDRIESAKKEVTRLAKAISDTLGNRDLEDLLTNGSDEAKKILTTGVFQNDQLNSEHASARAALLDLKQSLGPSYNKVEQQERRLQNILLDLQGKLSEPVEDPAVALARVRAMRELDPGVQKALTLIEDLDLRGEAKATDAREKLLKFHHLRQMLELAEFDVCKVGLTNADRRYVDALVAARWEAQSFKGGVYVDLYDFCDRIQEKLGMDKFLTELKNDIRSNPSVPAVVDSFTTGADFQHAHGLSVYFPVMAEGYTPKYMNLEFAKETGWGRLVRAYLEASRRTRRGEDTLWFEKEPIRRYKAAEIDPLRRGDIEARIVGVVESGSEGEAATTKPGKGGNSNTAKGGNSNTAKGGNSNTAKGGNSNTAKGGNSNTAKGKQLSTVFGNPPDGFYRRGTEQN